MAATNGTAKRAKRGKKPAPPTEPELPPSPLTISITAKVTGGPRDSIFRGEFSGDVEMENLPFLSSLFDVLKRDTGKPPHSVDKVVPRTARFGL